MRKFGDPGWYRYLWARRVPREARVISTLVVAVGMVGGGFFAADRLSTAAAGNSTGAYIISTRVTLKTVTVHRNGKIVTTTTRIVRRVKVKAHAQTVVGLQTVTIPGGTKVQRVIRLRYVPVTRTVDHVSTAIITRNGRTTTVIKSQPVTVEQTVPVTVSETQTQVVTNERTLTNVTTQNNTITSTRTTTNQHTNTVVTTVPVTTTRRVTTTTTTTLPITTTVVSTHESTVTTTRTVTAPGSTTTVLITTTGR